MQAIEKYHLANQKGHLPYAVDPVCHMAEGNYESLLHTLIADQDVLCVEGGYYYRRTREYIAQVSDTRIGWENKRRWLDSAADQVPFTSRILIKSPNGYTGFGVKSALVKHAPTGEFFLARPRKKDDPEHVDFVISRPLRAAPEGQTQFHEVIPYLFNLFSQTVANHPVSEWHHRRKINAQDVFRGNVATSS